MPKYLLLKHYRGGPEPHRPVPPMDQWAPEDVEAHMAFQHHVSELLESNGEYVDAQALTPARTWVRYGGPDAAPVTTDGPHPETSDLVAGWYMIDVESRERAVELAAYVSSEPGPGGEPLPSERFLCQRIYDGNPVGYGVGVKPPRVLEEFYRMLRGGANAGERIAHLVRDDRGELPELRQRRLLHQLRLDRLPLRDVAAGRRPPCHRLPSRPL